MKSTIIGKVVRIGLDDDQNTVVSVLLEPISDSKHSPVAFSPVALAAGQQLINVRPPAGSSLPTVGKIVALDVREATDLEQDIYDNAVIDKRQGMSGVPSLGELVQHMFSPKPSP